MKECHILFISICKHQVQVINEFTDGIRMLNEACASKEVIELKSLEAFAKAADGKATKIIIPSEIQGLAGMVSSVTEIAKSSGDK